MRDNVNGMPIQPFIDACRPYKHDYPSTIMVQLHDDLLEAEKIIAQLSAQIANSQPDIDELKRELHVWRVLVTTCMLQDMWDRGVRGADLTGAKCIEYMRTRMGIAYETGGFGEYEGISDPDDDSVDALDDSMIAMEKTVNRVCVQLHIPEFEISRKGDV